jgi:L-threonylcarbamoyladenylate synthase
MHTDVLNADQPNALAHAVDVLRRGGVVAFPTDTVYGIGALVSLPESIERLYTIKGRNATRAIAILIASPADLDKVAVNTGEMALRLATAYWPGPLTLIVPRQPDLPGVLSPGNTIGVRVPNHPVALRLLELAGPMAVTSANLSGQENTCTAADVLSQLNGRFHLLIDGGSTPGGVPSTVLDCTGLQPVMVREGPISLKDIQAVLG